MEKGKRDKKSRSDKKESGNDNGDALVHTVAVTKVSKKKKDKKNKQAEDSDEEGEEFSDQNVGTISRFGLLDLEDKSQSETESEPESKQQSKSSVHTAKKQAKSNVGKVAEENGVEEAVSKSDKKPKKKGKKGGKGADKEEDIDAIMAELSLQDTKKKGEKPSQGGIMEEEPSSLVPQAVKGSIVLENQSMTQDEIGKVMEEMYPDSSDDDKKKKKKNRKHKEIDGGQEGKDCENGDQGGTEKSEKNKAKLKSKKLTNQKQVADETILNEKNSTEAADNLPANKAVEQKKEELTKKTKQNSSEAAEKNEDKAQETSVKADAVSKDAKGKPEKASETSAAPDDEEKEDDDVEGGKKVKKNKQKKREKEKEKEKKEEVKKEKKPPQSRMAQLILEQQRLIKEQEEKLQREEEERIRKIEEAERLREEKERLEKEKKERKKQKKKEAKDRQIAEGTYLTAKQKAEKQIALSKLEALKKQGAEIPALSTADSGDVEKKKPRVVYGVRKKKPNQTQSEPQGTEKSTEIVDHKPTPTMAERQLSENKEEVTADVEPVEEEIVAEESDVVKETWEDPSEEEEEEEDIKPSVSTSKTKANCRTQSGKKSQGDSKSEDEESESDEEEDSSSAEDSDSDEESSEDERSPQEKAREKAFARIQARKAEAEAKRSIDELRAPVVCVLGHVDTGKTKILDKLRRTNVQDGEAGGITQQIGATNVPQDTIREQTKMCKDFAKVELKLPGLLIIDTPGHESFSNLRNRGSSLCDIAILVVDIMHGLEPQTKESIELLKTKNTPFVVALNKVDRLNEWQTSPHTDIVTTINKQKQSTKLHFDDRVKHIVVEFAEVGLNVALFHQNQDLEEYISMVPTSAHSGDGMGNLIAQICDYAQTMLKKRLSYLNDLQATVMEVKAIPGLGTTIDVILVNGCVHEGDTIIVAGQEGPIVTQIRALMMPQPLRELRVKNEYIRHKEVKAAQGCKIAASNLEKALAGLPMFVANFPDEVDIYKDELSQMLADVLGSIKVQERGVFVQASTLGSLEALLAFLTSSKIPYAGISIGPIHKRDVMKASVMLEHDPQYAVILAFDVKVERDAQDMADSLGVRIFVADIIYHLFDQFTKYREDWLRKKQEENKHLAVFPCKLRIHPQNVFKSRDPIVVGVNVEAGFLKQGTMICVPSKEFIELGRVSSIESNHKPVDKAARGQDVCIKIDPIPGEAPKMYGRHFDSTDVLVSKVTRETIDVVKNYFRDEMTKADWQLVVELKKTFAIL